MSRLGPDWVMGADGLRHRDAARVLLFDDEGRLLLAQGKDWDNPTRRWWFTIGGGLEPGEDPRSGAVRELREETGLVVDPGDLIGPVYTRGAIFDFYAETVRQDEVFFLARIHGETPLDRSAWSEVERDTILEMAWLTLDEIRALPEAVYPVGLADLAAAVSTGWDGVTRDLGQGRDPTPETATDEQSPGSE